MASSQKWVLGGLLFAGGLACGAYLFTRPKNDIAPPPPATPPRLSTADAEPVIREFCSGPCHAFPPADSFPRHHWRAEVERGYRFFEKSGMSGTVPPIEEVVKYFESRAPEVLPPAKLLPVASPVVRFEEKTYPAPSGGPKVAISHLEFARLTAPGKPGELGPAEIIACDMQGGRVMALDPRAQSPVWRVLARVPHPSHATIVDLDNDGVRDLLVADLGSFPPTDRRCGSVVWLKGKADGTFEPVTLLDNVGRVADVQAADFRGTGKLDLVVAAFGLHATGEVLYLENRTTDWSKPVFQSKRVDGRTGAIHVPVSDLNGDGKPDFVAVFAQEHEVVIAFMNDGKGGFNKQTLFKAPHPGYGSSGIELVDMNGDGRVDVLFSNGDILDEPYVWKPYHGIQWLENMGNLKFEHRFISPMYGAHRAVAGDVAGRGKKDVVAVSFLPGDKFPDRKEKKADAVVMFEQLPDGSFARHPIASADCDAVVCIVGDFYGTGRQDIAVGNFSSMSTDHPVRIFKNLGPAK